MNKEQALADDYDFTAAVRENDVVLPDSFEMVIALPSEAHDEGEYFWLLALPSGKFQVLQGSHDYTGWDCQSGADKSAPFEKEQIHLHVPQYDNQNRPIRALMLDALLGKTEG